MVALTRGGEFSFKFFSSCSVRMIRLMCLAGKITHQQGLVRLTRLLVLHFFLSL